MCTYNGSRFLREQLDSILRQSRLPDELIVSDDCSTDCTVEMICEFTAKAPFEVRLVVNKYQLGTTKNFEKCILLCTGDLIVLSDQDDYWYFDRLQLTENIMTERPDAGVLFADADIVDNDLSPLGYRLWKSVHFSHRLRRQFAQENAFEALIAHNVVTGATMAFRADYRSLVCPIPSLWVHDGWIAILVAAVANVIYIDRPLIKYRQHSNQQLGARIRSIAGHVTSTQERNNYENYKQMPERYRLVYDRLQETMEGGLPQKQRALLQAKIQHMVCRAELSKNHLRRVFTITIEMVLNRYRQFGYGWRDVIRDLLVNLED